jgi:hypothetical protein
MTRRRNKYFTRKWPEILSFIIVAAICGWAGCGKPVDPSSENSGRVIAVNGKARFQSYCLDDAGGSPVIERPVFLYECEIESEEVALTENLPTISLVGDCDKGTLTVRPHGPGLKESTWQLGVRDREGKMRFNIETDFGSARLVDDGQGNPNCNMYLTLQLYGTMTCGEGGANRYKPTIEVEAEYKINSSRPVPTTTTSTTSTTRRIFPFPPTTRPVDGLVVRPTVTRFDQFVGERSCSLPARCHFYSRTLMKQCQ